jgi:hypothetical protein
MGLFGSGKEERTRGAMQDLSAAGARQEDAGRHLIAQQCPEEMARLCRRLGS